MDIDLDFEMREAQRWQDSVRARKIARGRESASTWRPTRAWLDAIAKQALKEELERIVTRQMIEQRQREIEAELLIALELQQGYVVTR